MLVCSVPICVLVCVPVFQCASVCVAVWGHALLKLSAASPPSEARIDHGSMMIMMMRKDDDDDDEEEEGKVV